MTSSIRVPAAAAVEQVAHGTRPSATIVASFDGLGYGFDSRVEQEQQHHICPGLRRLELQQRSQLWSSADHGAIIRLS